MSRKLILITGGSIGGAVASTVLLLMSKTKSEKLLLSLFLASCLISCAVSIVLLRLGNKLLDASKCGDTAKVKSLLKTGISVDTKNSSKETPLLLAAQGNHIETAKLLLQHKANVNVSNEFGDTLLASAVKNGHMEVVELLLKHGADVAFAVSPSFMKWKDDNEFITSATKNGHIKILELLLNRGVSANLKDHHGESLLYIAVEAGCVETAKLLLAYGANVNFCKFRDTILHLAAANGQAKMVKLLVENGADVNAVDSYNYTPLHKATQCSDLDSNLRWFRYYLNNGTNHRNEKRKYEETAELLIKNGADIDAKGVDDIRPLHFAIYSGLSETVILLLKKGADANSPIIEQYYNFTPMDRFLLRSSIHRYASGRHYLKTFFTLLVFGANLTEEHMEKINNDDFYLKEYLTAFEEIKEMPHLGKIIRGCRERNFEVISNYINKDGKNRISNIKQLIQELQNVKRHYDASRRLSFISETLLDIIKFMMSQYRKTQFKIGALSGLICQAIHSELEKEVSLEDIVSAKVASILSGQDAINLSLVCKSINYKANDRTGINQHAKNKLLTQLEEIVVSSNASIEVGGPQVGG